MKSNENSYILIIGIGILVWISSFFIHTKIDLSEDKRFTLAPTSLALIQNLENPIVIDFYLNGDELPAGFKRLRAAVLATIEDFQSESNQAIELNLIDVYQNLEAEERDAIIIALDSMGIHPTNIIQTKNGQSSQTFALPGLVIQSNGQERGLLLLKGNNLSSPEEILNQSIEQIEFQLADAIKKISQIEKKNIGFLFDYGTYSPTTQFDFIQTLQNSYNLFPVDLENSPSLDGLDGICLINPNKKFSQESIYKIDQFLMKGGKAVFMMEGIQIDTVENQGIILTEKQTGLEEFLFRLGIRLNNNLLKDIQLCGAIPLKVGNFGDQPNLQLMPWPAFPLLQGNANSIITRNLDAVYSKFGSSIDTLNNSYKKTILLHTSNYTQTMTAPATLPFSSSTEEFKKEKYQEGEKIAGILVEGKFDSYFQNRILPIDSLKEYYTPKAKKEAQFVLIANSQLVENPIDPSTGAPLELGYDLFSQHNFGNKDFLLNVFNYLLEGENALLARNKSYQLRPLDKKKIQEEGSFLQFLNISIPAILTLLIGLFIYYQRKSNYTR